MTLFPDARTGIHAMLRWVAARAPDAEVILPDYNFFAVPAMVRRAGLRPVFVDVTAPAGEPSLDVAARAVTPRTRALLLGHFFGRPCDLRAWRDFAAARGLWIIEDCAHAYGASVDGRSVGRWGLGGAFSLSLTKGLTGVMGGAVVTDDPEMGAWLRGCEREAPALPRAEVVRSVLSALGGTILFDDAIYPIALQPLQRALDGVGVDLYERLMAERPMRCDPPAVATDAAMPSPCADLARGHLARARRDIEAQRARARAVISAGPWRRFRAPDWEGDRAATYLNLVLRAPEARALRRALLRRGIDTRGDYLSSSTGDTRAFPESARLVREGVYLPVRALRGDADLARLIDALRAFDAGATDVAPARSTP